MVAIDAAGRYAGIIPVAEAHAHEGKPTPLSALLLLAVFLYNVDDLQAIVQENISRRSAEIQRAEDIVAEEVGRFMAWRRSRTVVPTVVALRQRFDEIRKSGLYDEIWQAFAVLLPVRTVGVMGDGRTYDQACALRAVTSTDGMTADIYPFDAAFLSRVATRIVNEVQGINRVVYDISSKPPATIEWE